MGVVALDIDCVKYCLLHISHLQHQIFDGQIWPNAEQSFLLLSNAFKKNERKGKRPILGKKKFPKLLEVLSSLDFLRHLPVGTLTNASVC